MRIVPALLALGCVPVLESPDAGDVCADEGNAWVHGQPPETLEGEGFATGEVVEDFCMPDQHAQPVRLHQFYGDVVLLDVSTMWCPPCQAIAAEAQATADDYRDRGFVYVTVLAQDMHTDPPDRDELVYWGDSFGLTEPILSDTSGWYAGLVTGDAGFPALLVLDRQMHVARRDIVAEDPKIRAAIEDVLAE